MTGEICCNEAYQMWRLHYEALLLSMEQSPTESYPLQSLARQSSFHTKGCASHSRSKNNPNNFPVSQWLINTLTELHAPPCENRRICCCLSVRPHLANSTYILSNREAQRHNCERWQAGVHISAFGTWTSVAMVTPRISPWSTMWYF